jgi:hypothetical protein
MNPCAAGTAPTVMSLPPRRRIKQEPLPYEASVNKLHRPDCDHIAGHNFPSGGRRDVRDRLTGIDTGRDVPARSRAAPPLLDALGLAVPRLPAEDRIVPRRRQVTERGGITTTRTC